MNMLMAKFFGAGSISKVAPLFGGLTFIAAIQAQTDYSPWVEMWRAALTLGIGIFITLCGVIWRDINRRMTVEERLQKQRHDDNKREIERLSDRQNRMVGAMIAVAMAISKTDNIHGEQLAETIRALLVKGE